MLGDIYVYMKDIEHIKIKHTRYGGHVTENITDKEPWVSLGYTLNRRSVEFSELISVNDDHNQFFTNPEPVKYGSDDCKRISKSLIQHNELVSCYITKGKSYEKFDFSEVDFSQLYYTDNNCLTIDSNNDSITFINNQDK